MDEGFNRLWTKELLEGDPAVLNLGAREVLPVLDTVDLLLDIHSMQTALNRDDGRTA
ncbi:MAG: hypothetical protein CM1200mP30_21750 [Pseudomonadota bacterium]|nr:MAG: hypothetical protein CM1200mP30_21750 [Pseudomonadota bacterium]